MQLLVTAGPTREYFDTVRFISNPSSGRMGYAIAAEAATRHHRVCLVSGPVDLPPPAGVDVVRVVSAAEMFDAAVSAFHTCHAAVMTAAVCDYRPARRMTRKLRKRDRERAVRLTPTRDICAHLGSIKADRIVIGFAMEDHAAHARAEAKLARKRCDAIVLNGLENVGGTDAAVEILRADTGWRGPVRGTKPRIAVAVVDLVEALAG
ncbi:MAG: phosphopantothenoylcysteine decarboxylase [Phycisphaerae bacterium]